ncbi:glycosyltransferase family 2 protein [uncultured Paludibaculum sp.]|uniref:glycosyltransferase family 2 protein n=1 Tax=uncultured Paludibaculum sp. TaxID=1765020 RepID=UPI002AAB270A|nr:glycosyltransferase family 2 protein [uncultured Paludibaculum sp.]
MSTTPDVSIILVGRNSSKHLASCLDSLSSVEWGEFTGEVIYVDNASVDGSTELVRARCPDAKIISNSSNVGFCGACNQAIRASRARYVYLLNNDTLLLPNSIRPLVEFIDANPRAGAAGNRLLNPDGTDQWSARRFPSWRNALVGRRTPFSRYFARSSALRDYLYKEQMAGTEPFAVDWVPGSCTLVRREACERIGLLPEDLHYWSDAVFCIRLKRAGWTIHIVPTSPLVHFEGEGTGRKTAAVRRWLISDFHRGAYHFYCEQNGFGSAHPARWLVKGALSIRAGLLIFADRVAHVETANNGGT